MKLYIMSVRDRTADSFGQPFFTTSLGQAQRSFQDEVNRSAQDNLLYMHPDDFDLYHLGLFDTDDGSFEAHTPKQIAVGASMKIVKNTHNNP